MSLKRPSKAEIPQVSLRLFRFSTDDPEELGEALAPVAAGVSAEAADRGVGFNADVQEAALPGMGLFRVQLIDAQILRVPEQYLAVTVPVGGELTLGAGRRAELFNPGKAHLLWPSDELDLQVDRGADLLVCTFPESRFATTAPRSRISNRFFVRPRPRDLNLRTQEGQAFYRYLSFVWTEVYRGADYLESPQASGEIEAMCVRLFELAMASDLPEEKERTSMAGNPHLHRACDFIEANLAVGPTLAEITKAAGTSASSLLRAFKKELGTTPVRFLKDRRLDAVRTALLLADPERDRVSEIAGQYGFHQFGRFAGDFKQAFGELPSDTLRRQARR